MQHDFHYVSKEKAKEEKRVLTDIIHQVQNIVREKFTFRYKFIGSASRNMITYDTKSNRGYDFDVNIYISEETKQQYTEKELRNCIRNALNWVGPYYGYSYCEDSTRVLTIKRISYMNSSIQHRCDFAIVYDCKDGRQQYIKFVKKSQVYIWQFQPKGYQELPQKIEWLKKEKLWNELRDYYIVKKNKNDDPNKKSRAVFAETVHEMCQKYGYRNRGLS